MNDDSIKLMSLLEELEDLITSSSKMPFSEKGIIDLKKAGVIDPARVTKEAVQNAVSIAATAITMGALIVDVPEKEAPASPDMGGMY